MSGLLSGRVILGYARYLGIDPETEPTYEELYEEFSLPDGKYGKVGSDFIEVLEAFLGQLTGQSAAVA